MLSREPVSPTPISQTSPTSASQASPSQPSTHQPALILCAEDQEALRIDICDELREAGYAVLEAADGDEALRQIDIALPDLILCDINMPGRNGYEILTEIRTHRPDLADTPLIFLTALSASHEVIEGKSLGADDYLVKPIDFDLLLATVDARLRQVSRMRAKSNNELQQLRHAMGLLHREVSQQAFQSATRALDLVTPGMVLLNQQGRVSFANQRALQLAEASGVLRLQDTLESWGVPNRALRDAIDAALEASLQGKETVFSLRLPYRPGDHGLLVLVCSLGSPSGAIEEEVSVVVMLSAPDQRTPLPRSVLASLFGLTPAETRIALALLKGLRCEEIAEQMVISPTTVAFHLRNLFQKTDTRRQADLIALLLAGSMTAYLEGR